MNITPTPVTKTQPHIAVVGSGPVGVRFVEELLNKNPNSRITLFGEERVRPYNRVQLSSLLAGDVSVDDIELTLPEESENFTFKTIKIEQINLSVKRIIDANNQSHNFDKLILATGARAHIPNIDGIEQSGVYSFRNLRDAESLYARTSRANHIVIVGGGLLGIETAKALLKNNTKVTIVQQGSHLMNKQLDPKAAELLTDSLSDLGIRVITNTGVRKINGDGRVTGVTLRNREFIECDTVLFCSGISPNMEMARAARLRVNRGIIVDDTMQTSHDSVYAIGECCEHEGLTYGIVNPGYEQAAVLANVIDGGDINYRGSLQSSSLKVIDTPVRSFGQVVNYKRTPFHKEVVYQKGDVYRKIITNQGVLVGGVCVGEWEEFLPTLEAFQQERKITLFQRLLFKFKGRLFVRQANSDVTQWRSDAVVCQCTGVTQALLMNALRTDCKTVCELSNKTKAGTVCGSCKPLLSELVANTTGQTLERIKEWAWTPMLIISVLAFIVASIVLLTPGLPAGLSVEQPSPFEFFWNDKYWKQVSGFILLALSAIGLFMSLQKKIKSPKLGKFAHWRMLHITLGLVSAVMLFFHSGLHLGKNLNRLLMLDFLLVIALGSLAGLVISLSHYLPSNSAKKVRSFWSWTHILVTWPLPILLAAHIFTVYYY